MLGFSRKTAELPRAFVPVRSETIRIDRGIATQHHVGRGEALHLHSGALVGCTVMAALAVKESGNIIVHGQHFRSPERERGFTEFEDAMTMLSNERDIVRLVAGVLSPRNKTKIPTVGPWVTPLSGEERLRIMDAAETVHGNATIAFASYDIRRAQIVWDRPEQYVRMDVVIPTMGDPRITILDGYGS